MFFLFHTQPIFSLSLSKMAQNVSVETLHSRYHGHLMHSLFRPLHSVPNCYQEWNLIILIWKTHCHITLTRSLISCPPTGLAQDVTYTFQGCEFEALSSFFSMENSSTRTQRETRFVTNTRKCHSGQTLPFSFVTWRCHSYLEYSYPD